MTRLQPCFRLLSINETNEPMFWSGSLSRDISAVANLIPSARSTAISRLMCMTESQPSTSAAVMSSQSTMAGSSNTSRKIASSWARVSFRAALSLEEMRQPHEILGDPQPPERLPAVGPGRLETECRIMVGDQSVFGRGHVRSAQPSAAFLAGEVDQLAAGKLLHA